MLRLATISFMGLDVGPWSGWFSGIMTAVGIYIAINKGKMKFEFHSYISKDNELEYNVNNRSQYDVQTQGIGLSFRSHLWKHSEFFSHINYYTSDKDRPSGMLKSNIMWHDTSSWSNIPEFSKRKKCYVIIFVVASDGATYYGRPKKYRVKDFESNFLETKD